MRKISLYIAVFLLLGGFAFSANAQISTSTPLTEDERLVLISQIQAQLASLIQQLVEALNNQMNAAPVASGGFVEEETVYVPQSVQSNVSVDCEAEQGTDADPTINFAVTGTFDKAILSVYDPTGNQVLFQSVRTGDNRLTAFEPNTTYTWSINASRGDSVATDSGTFTTGAERLVFGFGEEYGFLDVTTYIKNSEYFYDVTLVAQTNETLNLEFVYTDMSRSRVVRQEVVEAGDSFTFEGVRGGIDWRPAGESWQEIEGLSFDILQPHSFSGGQEIMSVIQ